MINTCFNLLLFSFLFHFRIIELTHAGYSLANAEIYLASAFLIRRFNFELYDVIKERDVDVVRDCFVGLTRPDTKGVRFKVLDKRN